MKCFWVSTHGVVEAYEARKVTVTVAPLPKEAPGLWFKHLSGQEVKAIEIALPEPDGLVYLHDPDGKVFLQLQKPGAVDGVKALLVSKVDPPVGVSKQAAPAPAPVRGEAPEPPRKPSAPSRGTMPQDS